MKAITLLISLMITAGSFAQVGIGTTTPHASTCLEINSTDKGILLPRMTGTQMLAINNPAEGLIVYNTTSNSFWYYKPATGWNNLSFMFPFSQTVVNSGTLLQLTNSSTSNTQPTLNVEAASGNAIYGKGADTWSGVYGENNSNGKGISGLNTGTGHGVNARGVHGTAIFADIPTGTGTAARFKQTNTAGYALETEGRVKIYGGHTDPNVGYFLTSRDNAGTAAWKPQPTTNPKISFEERGMAAGGLNVLQSDASLPGLKYHPGTELYDPGNNFNGISQSPTSTFVAPAAGLYSLQAAATFPMMSMSDCYFTMVRERNGNFTLLGELYEDQPLHFILGGYTTKSLTLSYSTTTHLQAGDRIWIGIRFHKEGGSNATFSTAAEYHSVAGTLVYAD